MTAAVSFPMSSSDRQGIGDEQLARPDRALESQGHHSREATTLGMIGAVERLIRTKRHNFSPCLTRGRDKVRPARCVGASHSRLGH